MFNLERLLKEVVAAGATAFSAVFPAASIVGNYTAAKAAVVAGLSAAFGAAVMLVGQLVKQLWDIARGYLRVGADEAVGLLSEAQVKIREALKALDA